MDIYELMQQAGLAQDPWMQERIAQSGYTMRDNGEGQYQFLDNSGESQGGTGSGALGTIADQIQNVTPFIDIGGQKYMPTDMTWDMLKNSSSPELQAAYRSGQLDSSHFKTDAKGRLLIHSGAQDVLSQFTGTKDSGGWLKNAISDGGFINAFSKTIGPALGFTSIMNGLGYGASAGGAGGGSGLPDSYWSQLADAGGTVSDAAPAGAGSFGEAGGFGGTLGELNGYINPSFNQIGQSGMLQNLAPGAGMTALNGSVGGLSAVDALMSGGVTGAGAAALGGGAANVASNGSIWSQIAEKLGTSTAGRLLNGTATGDEYLKALGAVGSAGLGLLGANAQSNALNDVSDKYLALGKPFRDKLSASYAPGFDLSASDPAYKGALEQSSNAVLKGLSASTGGNPFDNPGAVMEANKYVTQNVGLPQLNTYRSQLGSFGQLGTNTAGTADLGNAANAGSGLDALGYGLGQLTGSSNSFEDIIKKYGGMLGANKYPINLTGLGS